MEKEFIYKVSFKRPPLPCYGKTDFYFTSLSAIYEIFKPFHIGCKVSNLWNTGVSKGNKYESDSCTITRERIFRMRQKRRISPDK